MFKKILTAVFATISLCGIIWGQGIKPGKKAPLNPEFLQYTKQKSAQKMQGNQAIGASFGLIPGPQIISMVKPNFRPLDQALPSVYDLRSLGNKLTPVRNQATCGSCWAFAAFGSLESSMMPNSPADFSEQNLIDNSGFYWGPCEGGNIFMASAYLTRWSGPFYELDDPYIYTQKFDGATLSPRNHVQNIQFYPPRSMTTDNAILKNAILTSGAIYTEMNWVDSGYSATYSSFYNAGAMDPYGNHAVCIVGWDDNFPISKFNTPPPINGAFIVRNSWGTGWGDYGYFYVSYCDTKFARNGGYSASIQGESIHNYKRIYQYDPLGWIGDWGWDYPYSSAWGANIFNASESGNLAAVGFIASSANFSYQVYIYKGVIAGKPRSGTLVCSTSGTRTLPGYYTIKLPKLIPLKMGQKFSVVVKFTTPGYYFPVPTEDYEYEYSDGAVSFPGESFISLNGKSGTYWQDISADSYYQSNCCIKAYTQLTPSINITAPAGGALWTRGGTYDITWTKVGSQNASVKIQLFKGTMLVKSITTLAPNNGSFSWTIPATLPYSTAYTVKIITKDGLVKGVSPKFTITP